MLRAMGDTNPGTPNRILGGLPAEERERLWPHLERLHLEQKRVPVEPNRPIEFVYFPEGAMVSVLSIMADGSAVDVATVGWEGMVGLPVFLGGGSMAGQAVTQIAGGALRMPAGAFREEVRQCDALTARLNRYTQALFTELAQSSGCNRAQRIDQRCRGDSFTLTHLFLSQMLGVRRASVSRALGGVPADRTGPDAPGRGCPPGRPHPDLGGRRSALSEPHVRPERRGP